MSLQSLVVAGTTALVGVLYCRNKAASSVKRETTQAVTRVCGAILPATNPKREVSPLRDIIFPVKNNSLGAVVNVEGQSSGSNLQAVQAQPDLSAPPEATAVNQKVNKDNFKAELKEYCSKGNSFGEKLSNLMIFIFLSIAYLFKPDYALSSLNGRVNKS